MNGIWLMNAWPCLLCACQSEADNPGNNGADWRSPKCPRGVGPRLLRSILCSPPCTAVYSGSFTLKSSASRVQRSSGTNPPLDSLPPGVSSFCRAPWQHGTILAAAFRGCQTTRDKVQCLHTHPANFHLYESYTLTCQVPLTILRHTLEDNPKLTSRVHVFK